MPLRVLQFGLGPIGIETARTVLSKHPSALIELVGAVDKDPAKAGRDLTDIVGTGAPREIHVFDDVDRALTECRPDVVLHTTSSFLDRVEDQIAACVRAGAHVVSSTEELAYPYARHPEVAGRLNRLASEYGVSVVGTGVNPGYAMDTLALAATAPCVSVRSIHVERVVDAGARHLPLQLKVGAGITAEVFAERKAAGGFGHIGLVESVRMVAAGLGWTLDDVEESLEPVLSPTTVRTPFLAVSEGQVAGIHHSARGLVEGRAGITLDLKMYVGAEHPRDAIAIEGAPPVKLVIEGGIFGDTATVGLLVNTAGLVSQAPRGLITMAEMPVPRAFATGY